MAASKSEGIDWGHWAKLSEIKVYEALAFLDGREPPENCPDADDESSAYRKRMRLLVDALSNREWFGPHALNMGDPLLHGVSLAEVGRWAKANGYSLPVEFPCAVAKADVVRNSGGASIDAAASTTKLNSSRVTISEAKQRILEASPCELFMDFHVEADGAITTVADGVPKSIFAAHLDEDFAGNCEKLGIVPSWKYRPGKTGYTGDSTTDDFYTITSEEVERLAHWYGIRMEAMAQPIPEFVTSPRPLCVPIELKQLDPSATVTPRHQVAPVTNAETEGKEARQDRRLQACIDAGLTMPNAAVGRLPDGVGKVATAEGVTRQSFSDDVKAALKRRDAMRREGLIHHLR